jgi:hypothetical protein
MTEPTITQEPAQTIHQPHRNKRLGVAAAVVLPYLRRFAADVVMKHMIISGCRATWCAFSPRGARNPRPRCYWLLINAKEHSATSMYSFMALDNDADRTGVENELMKIRDSIRIIKAK